MTPRALYQTKQPVRGKVLFDAAGRGSRLRHMSTWVLHLFIRLPDFPFPELFPADSLSNSPLGEFTVSWLHVQSKYRFSYSINNSFLDPEAIYRHNYLWLAMPWQKKTDMNGSLDKDSSLWHIQNKLFVTVPERTFITFTRNDSLHGRKISKMFWKNKNNNKLKKWKNKIIIILCELFREFLWIVYVFLYFVLL